MLVRGLGLGVVVAVAFGLSVSSAGAAAPAGGVLAFGVNDAGQLGSITNAGTNNPNPTPTLLALESEIGPVTEVAAGGAHSLAVTASGQLYAFGSDFWGQLGSPPNNAPDPTPTLVGLPGEIGPVTQVAAGAGHSLVVTASGQLYAFGLNGTGELGSATDSGTSKANPTPTLVGLPGEIGPVTQVAAGGRHSLVVTASGQLYAFGLNGTGELGSATNNGTNNPNSTPTLVTLPGEIGPVTQVAAGSNHSLAVTASGQLYAFGLNAYGQLGSATNNDTDNPTPTPRLVSLASGTTIDTVAKGEEADHSLVIVSDLAITSSALPPGQAGSSYQATLTATGGTTPLAWSQTGLPSGLSIDPHTGVLAGTPTSAGSSQVTTTATDSYGNQTSHTYTLTINAPPAPECGAGQTGTPPGCRTPPLLTNVHESHRDWRERNLRQSKHHLPTGTTFSYTLNEPAAVTLAFTQKHPGRILAHRCQTPTKGTHNKPRCTRTQTITTLTAAGHAGPNHLPFKGRIRRAKKLGPGTYTLVITAHAFGSASRPRTLTFTILAG
jgi:Putative Ig domain/Regulator of chromosome condensation (RCC1) repeat